MLSAFYLPLILMLVGLIFRGVAFEFRFKATRRKRRHWWDKAFAGGSVAAAFFQGVTLGAFVQGVPVTRQRSMPADRSTGSAPFSLFTGVGLVVAYALLGCTWLIMKTEGDCSVRMRQLARLRSRGRCSRVIVLHQRLDAADAAEHRRSAGSACPTCSGSRRCRCWCVASMVGLLAGSARRGAACRRSC